jgi:polysaccharide pyruvyl transferase WcaK-like protein
MYPDHAPLLIRSPELQRRLASALSSARGGRPEVAVFAEWNAPDLGERAIHHEVLRFFSDCGWQASSYGLGTLAPRPGGSNRAGGFVTEPEHPPPASQTLREVRQGYRMVRLLRPLSRVQAVAVGGGALLTDVNLHFPQSLAMVAEAARLLAKPLLCLGCSADGPWSERGTEKIGGFLDACSLIAVRDEATADRISGMLGKPVPVFGDFCLTENHVVRTGCLNYPRPGLGINVCQLPAPWSASQQRYEDTLVALALHLAQSSNGPARRTIRVFTAGAPEDSDAARRVVARLEKLNPELHVPSELGELIDLLRTSMLVIASSLHGAVLPLAEGVPVVAFSPAPALRDFLSTMGLQRYSFDLDRSAQLAHCLATAPCETILVEQRRALVSAPVWLARAQIRSTLESVARYAPF